MTRETDWFQLSDYVEKLLRDGKRSQHEDFQMLFGVFGEERITKMAKEMLEKWKQNESSKAKNEEE